MLSSENDAMFAKNKFANWGDLTNDLNEVSLKQREGSGGGEGGERRGLEGGGVAIAVDNTQGRERGERGEGWRPVR